MASVVGTSVRLSIFGESHSAGIGCTIDGVPAGIPIDMDELQAFLDRRAPGTLGHGHAAPRSRRSDIPLGILDGHTTGSPIGAVIENADTRSGDYAGLRTVPRPGHADFPARMKYGNWHDVSGGGHFSGQANRAALRCRRHRKASARHARNRGRRARLQPWTRRHTRRAAQRARTRHRTGRRVASS